MSITLICFSLIRTDLPNGIMAYSTFRSRVLPATVSPRRACRSASLFVCAALAGGTVTQAQDSEPTLHLVQPMARAQLLDPLVRHYLKHLPQYWSGKVAIREIGRSQMLDRVRAAMNDERADRTVTLMTPLPYGQIYDEQLAMRSEVRPIPLQMVAKRPWCLASTYDVRPRNRTGFTNWLSGLNRPVRIGLASAQGMPAIWIKAMERKTGLAWVSTDFFANAEQGLSSLFSGQQDVLLETCAEMSRMLSNRVAVPGEPKLQLLLSEQPSANKSVANFAQWQLPTPAPSWAVWFVSSKMPEARRNRVAAALNAVTLREDTQALIRELGQEPMPMSVSASQAYVESWLGDWKSIKNWMNNLPEKAQGVSGAAASRPPRG